MLFQLLGMSPAVRHRRLPRIRAGVVASELGAAPSLAAWPSLFTNSLLRDLRAEPAELSPLTSREVKGAHYTRVRPTVTAPAPALVAYSPAVAESLGLSPAACECDEFLRFFSGTLPADIACWATVYGASFAGRYGGQRGDGRAISVGQVRGKEVQLKGAGRTPYSRRSDGRAVLRSSVREFLGQEAMAALGIPTTRSLCLVATGEVPTLHRAHLCAYTAPACTCLCTCIAPACTYLCTLPLHLHLHLPPLLRRSSDGTGTPTRAPRASAARSVRWARGSPRASSASGSSSSSPSAAS